MLSMDNPTNGQGPAMCRVFSTDWRAGARALSIFVGLRGCVRAIATPTPGSCDARRGAIAFCGFAVSQTIAFGHDWIPAGIAAVQDLARDRGFRLT